MVGFRRHIPFAVACIVVIASTLLSAVATPVSFATVGPEGSPTVHGTKIACYRPETNRYVGRVDPSKCELWGKVEFAGYLQGEQTEEFRRAPFSRLGLGQIEWLGGWGRSVDRGLATLDRSGRETFVDAYHRVKCADGSIWYGKANIYKDAGVFYELRLAVCGRPLSAAGGMLWLRRKTLAGS